MAQIFILIFGCTAIWLVSRKDKWKRYGYIFGLCSQPFWIYTSYANQQWGILALCFFYTYSWTQGIYNYWIKKDDEEPKRKKKYIYDVKKTLDGYAATFTVIKYKGKETEYTSYQTFTLQDTDTLISADLHKRMLIKAFEED